MHLESEIKRWELCLYLKKNVFKQSIFLVKKKKKRKEGERWVPGCLAVNGTTRLLQHCSFTYCLGVMRAWQTLALEMSLTPAACSVLWMRNFPAPCPWGTHQAQFVHWMATCGQGPFWHDCCYFFCLLGSEDFRAGNQHSFFILLIFYFYMLVHHESFKIVFSLLYLFTF